jgi:hypothetical protein
LLRHTVATLAYRGGKVVRGVPESAHSYRVGPDARTPLEILAHSNDLLDWAQIEAGRVGADQAAAVREFD